MAGLFQRGLFQPGVFQLGDLVPSRIGVRPTLWDDPRVKPPPGSVYLDLEHPLARKLAFAALLNEEGGLTVCAVTQRSSTVAGSWTPSPTGPALSFATADLLSFGDFSDWNLAATDDVSCVALVSAPSEANSRSILDKRSSAGNFEQISFQVNNDTGGSGSAGRIACFRRGSTGNFRHYHSNSTSLVDGRLHQYGFALDATADSAKLFSDGVEVASTASVLNAYPAVAPAEPLRIARTSAGGTMVVVYAYYWKRKLTPDDIAWLHAEPYGLFKAIHRRRVFAIEAFTDISPTGIPSGEAFGTPEVRGMDIFPVGIASAEAFGTPLIQDNRLLPSGIASSEAFGLAKIQLREKLFPVGIASAEAFGTPIVYKTNTPLPTTAPSSPASLSGCQGSLYPTVVVD